MVLLVSGMCGVLLSPPSSPETGEGFLGVVRYLITQLKPEVVLNKSNLDLKSLRRLLLFITPKDDGIALF